MRIRVARHAAKFTQEALADRLGVTRGAVANWECVDEAMPASRRLEKIALVTGVAYEWLATGRGGMLLDNDSDGCAVPAVDALFVEDPVERRLLLAFRAAPPRIQKVVLETAETPFKRAAG